MILFFLMNLIVGVSAFLLDYRLFKFSGLVDSLLAFFILYFAQIVISELILGILGLLYLNNVFLVNLAILLIIYLITKNSTSSFNLEGIKDTIYGLSENKIILLVVSVILGFALVKIGINLINPPFGWDSLNYHFTFGVEWLKHGNLDTPITISDDPSPSYYPINGSLFYLWLMLPLHSVFLADLGQLPFFILTFLSVYSIGIKLGLGRELAFLSACLFSIIPNYFKQLQIAYVDVMVAGLFLAGVNFLFLLNEAFTLRNVTIYALAVGLLIGTKTVALAYSALLLLPFVYFCFKNIRKSYLFVLVVLIIACIGGFSYFRNLVDTGNPFYPLDFKILGKTIFKGVMDITVYRAHFKIEDYSIGKLLFHEGLGLQTLLFVLPAVFLTLPAAIIKRKKNLDFYQAYFLLIPIFIYLIYRYIIPLANTRYLYPLLGLGIVIGFYLYYLLNVPRRVIQILVILCAIFSMCELAKRQELIVSTLLVFLLFLTLLFFGKTIKRTLAVLYKPLPILFLTFISLTALVALYRDYEKNQFLRYIRMVKYSGFWQDATVAWKWLNDNTAGNNIAYIGRPVPFPLYGANFKNNVYYVSVNKIEPAKLHYFPESRYQWRYDFLTLHKNLEMPGNYRGDADYGIWLNNLLKRNTDFLFIYSLHQTREVAFPLEDYWARLNPDKFIQVFTNQTIHIYKIAR